MSQFTGSLLSKRKADLIEIAEALGINERGATMQDLRERISLVLQGNTEQYRDDPQFSGLYKAPRRLNASQSDDSPQPEVKTPRRPRKSVNKTIANVMEAANIPLPESPITKEHLQNTREHLQLAGEQLQNAGEHALDAANHAANQVLTVVDRDAGEVANGLKRLSGELVKVGEKQKVVAENFIREARDALSQPRGLLLAALALEAASVYNHVAPFNHHTLSFPPSIYSSNKMSSLVGHALFWVPELQWTVRFPRWDSYLPSSDLWPAFAWWFFATVLPPLALSTIVSFVPQKGERRRNRDATPYEAAHPPEPTVDPLTFALFRTALLLVPLTGAAPSSFNDAMEVIGNVYARALGGGLTTALIIAERLTSH